MTREPRCRRCGYLLRGRSVDDACPECGLPIAESFDRRPTGAVTALLVTVALIQLPVMAWVFFRSEPRALFGMAFSTLFTFIIPTFVASLAFALSAAGFRFSKRATVIVLLAVLLGGAVTWWFWTSMLWGV